MLTLFSKKLNWADYLYDVDDLGDYVVLHPDVPGTIEKIGEDEFNYRGGHFDCFYPNHCEGEELSEDEKSYTFTKEKWESVWKHNFNNGDYAFEWVE